MITDYDQVPTDQIPEALGEIATIQARLLQRLLTPAVSEPSTDQDFNLTPDDVAKRVGKDRRWVYRHAAGDLGGKKLGHRTWRFSEAGVRSYLASL